MLRCFTYGALSRGSKAKAIGHRATLRARLGARLGTAFGIGLAILLAVTSPARADRVDILALGDSLTAGYGLIDQNGFVPQLRAWLAARGHDVRIVNAGVSGDTTAGGLSRVAWSLTPELDAIIVALGGNDLLRGLPPESVRANVQGILDVAHDADLEIMVVGMSAPGNYGQDYKETFDAIYPDLAQQYGAIHHDSFFIGLMSKDTDPADLRAFMQADGIHPNADGVARIVEGMGPVVETLIARVQARSGS
ncbi:MAG: arylesterase [Primorskyibacter sp.]